jgi:hypothetical protein
MATNLPQAIDQQRNRLQHISDNDESTIADSSPFASPRQ